MVSVSVSCACAGLQARHLPVRSYSSAFAGNYQWSLARLLALKVSALVLFSPAVALAQGMFPAAPNVFASECQSRLLAPLQHLSPVTDAMLADPPPQEWLMWRRTYDGWGFSPLRQITRKNVGTLQVAWSWSMTSGAMEATPIVHDGVLFIQNYGDNVEALNAETSDLLWRYDHAPPPAVRTGPQAPAPKGIWERLKQHKVAQWTLAYAAAAYTLLHGVEMISAALDWPHLIARILTLLLVLGVPVVITLAWYRRSPRDRFVARRLPLVNGSCGCAP